MRALLLWAALKRGGVKVVEGEWHDLPPTFVKGDVCSRLDYIISTGGHLRSLQMWGDLDLGSDSHLLLTT